MVDMTNMTHWVLKAVLDLQYGKSRHQNFKHIVNLVEFLYRKNQEAFIVWQNHITKRINFGVGSRHWC